MERTEQQNHGTAIDNGNIVDAASIFDYTPNGDGGGFGASDGNSGSGGNFDVTAPYGRNKDGSPRKKRGRRAGVHYPSGNGTATKAGIPAVDAIAGTLYGIHGAIAAIAKIPELELTEEQSKQLAKATAVAAEVSGADIDPRMAAYVNLAVVALSIYGPKGLAAYARIKMERERDAKHQQA